MKKKETRPGRGKTSTVLKLVVVPSVILLSGLGYVQYKKYLACRCANLEKNIPKENFRYKTFKHVLGMLSERGAKVLVETGTARGGKDNFLGDGGSTLIFGEWASKKGATLYSVDIDPMAIQKADKDLDLNCRKNVELVNSDSIPFLRNFNQTIDFLYLDSYDFDSQNPNPSQEHHLKEIMAAYPWLSENSIVMIDDCDLPHGGKGKLVINYLLNNGWKIVQDGYQVIMVKK